MKRQTILLVVLASVLVTSMYWFLMFRPQREELAAVETRIVAQEDEQARLRLELERLQLIRDRAPEVEAELTAMAAIVPEDTALPAAVAQLQRAADDARITMLAVSTSRPSPLPESVQPITAIDLTAQVEGSYFQLVDFFRRIEDPTITARGLQWTNVTVARGEYPLLTVSLSGTIYTLAPSTPPPPEAEADTDAEGDPSAPEAGGSDTDIAMGDR
ncbi:hypothetical protein [Egicoccus sp. AB-alg6-2]|uniref:hypothetical protein n=1 Tax=Egicoccus sp. AB-alg6-2 TaxID=3242692 RepID=UPI00359CE5AC